MPKYMMNFPRGVKADVFNPPEDFEEQIRESLDCQGDKGGDQL